MFYLLMQINTSPHREKEKHQEGTNIKTAVFSPPSLRLYTPLQTKEYKQQQHFRGKDRLPASLSELRWSSSIQVAQTTNPFMI